MVVQIARLVARLWSRPARVLSLALDNWRSLPRPRPGRLHALASVEGECDSSSLPLPSVDECSGVTPSWQGIVYLEFAALASSARVDN